MAELINLRRGFAAAIPDIADGAADADADQRRSQDADGEEHPGSSRRKLVQVFGIVPGRHQADRMESERRRHRAEQRREQDHPQAQSSSPSAFWAQAVDEPGDRHGGDQRQAHKDVLHLVRIVPAAHRVRDHQDEGDRDDQVRRQAGGQRVSAAGASRGSGSA